MKQTFLSLVMAMTLSTPVLAQEAASISPETASFTLKKGAAVADDFGRLLSRRELKEGLQERGIIARKPYNNLGNTFVINGARWQGKTYRIKVDRYDGTVTWFASTDGLYSVQKF